MDLPVQPLFKNLNSKRFLLIYLLLVVVLLAVWSDAQQPDADLRVLPEPLKPYLRSPAQPLPALLLPRDDGYVLTNNWFEQKWTIVYFSHPACQPGCAPVLEVLANLSKRIADRDLQFVLLGPDLASTPLQLPATLAERAIQVSVDAERLQQLSQQFVLWYRFADGRLTEQQHSLFVIDPQARIYGRFDPPYTSLAIHQHFNQMRRFYALSE